MKIQRKVYQYSSLLLMAICLLALKPEDLGEPWSEVARLIKSRDYSGAIDKLQAAARSSNDVEYLAEIYYRIGFIHHEYTHDYDRALDAYRKVVDLGKEVKSPSAELEIYMALSRMGIAGIYFRVGRYDDAIKTYKQMAADYPGTPYAEIAAKKIKDIGDALEEIKLRRQIVDKYPGTDFAAEALFEIAELYLPIQPQQAIQEYAGLVRQYPNSRRAAEAQLKIGDTYRTPLNEPEEAISAYQKLVRSQPIADKWGAEALFRVGRLYSQLDHYREALDAFNRFLRDYPTYWKMPAVFYWQGICYEQLKDYDNAISAFEMLVQVYPDEKPDWLADIGRLGETKVKAEIESRIEKLKKMASETLWQNAERLRSRGEYREALALYRDLMGRYPDSEYSGRAKIQAEGVKDLAEIQICRDVVKKGGAGAATSQYNIAKIYETKMQNYPRAIEEYEKVVADFPDTYWATDALYNMGLIYSGLSSPAESEIHEDRKNVHPDYYKAIEKFHQLIREYPHTYAAAESYYQMGEIYRNHLKDYDQALKAYGKVVNDYPVQSLYVGEGYKDSLVDRAQFRIGRIYYENLQDYDTALKTFTKFLNDYPSSCRKAAAYSFIAAIQEKRKDREAALNSLERIIDITVDSDIQSSFFIRDATYEARSIRNGLRGFDLQRDIIKQIRRRISQLQGQN